MRRYWTYLKSVLKHKWYVYKACKIMKAPLWVGIVHDWRKFLPIQFVPYAHNFYNTDGSKRNVRDKTGAYNPILQDMLFRRAWCDHQKALHHWQAWCVIGDSGGLRPIPMTEVYIREMIADWMGAGGIYGNYDPHEWWETNHEKMILTPGTWNRIQKH